jgi:hypothetical protein
LINILHYLWADQNVYFRGIDMVDHVRFLAEAVEPYRVYDRVVFNRTMPVQVDDERSSELIHHYRSHAPIEAEFQFSKLQKLGELGKMGRWRLKPERPARGCDDGEAVRYEIRKEYLRPRRTHLKGNALRLLTRRLLQNCP